MCIVDNRSYRDIRLPNSDDPRADDPNRMILGAPQLARLESELRESNQWRYVEVRGDFIPIGLEPMFPTHRILEFKVRRS